MNKKIKSFISRNRIRNAKLYQPGLIKGVDFIECPVSNERLLIIRSDYITNILGMTVEEYDQKFPNVQKRCQAHRDNIKKGIQTIDPQTGLTKYQMSQIKARQVLTSLDENGVSGYKKKGQKTRATHMNKLDELGRNGYSQLASKAIIKGNITKAKKGLILDPSIRSEFYRYKAIVTYLTEKHRSVLTEGYITGLAGTSGAYQIDHNYSIMHGYRHKISPLLIGNINNLTMIPWKDNLQKHTTSSITLDKLLELTNYTQEQSEKEFNIIIDLIRKDSVNNIPVSGARILEKLNETTLY